MTRGSLGLALFVLLALLALWATASAQPTLLGSITFTGPTTARTFTLPDANGRVVVTATAGAWKMAAGSITLDGTNPSSATTGLATIVACTVTDNRATAPADELSVFTTGTAATAGQLDVYAWKATGAGTTTLIASTDNNDVVDYICIGT